MQALTDSPPVPNILIRPQLGSCGGAAVRPFGLAHRFGAASVRLRSAHRARSEYAPPLIFPRTVPSLWAVRPSSRQCGRAAVDRLVRPGYHYDRLVELVQDHPLPWLHDLSLSLYGLCGRPYGLCGRGGAVRPSRLLETGPSVWCGVGAAAISSSSPSRSTTSCDVGASRSFAMGCAAVHERCAARSEHAISTRCAKIRHFLVF